jgi:hypothetical protein
MDDQFVADIHTFTSQVKTAPLLSFCKGRYPCDLRNPRFFALRKLGLYESLPGFSRPGRFRGLSTTDEDELSPLPAGSSAFLRAHPHDLVTQTIHEKCGDLYMANDSGRITSFG